MDVPPLQIFPHYPPPHQKSSIPQLIDQDMIKIHFTANRFSSLDPVTPKTLLVRYRHLLQDVDTGIYKNKKNKNKRPFPPSQQKYSPSILTNYSRFKPLSKASRLLLSDHHTSETLLSQHSHLFKENSTDITDLPHFL